MRQVKWRQQKRRQNKRRQDKRMQDKGRQGKRRLKPRYTIPQAVKSLSGLLGPRQLHSKATCFVHLNARLHTSSLTHANHFG